MSTTTVLRLRSPELLRVAAVAGGALLFGILLVLVRLQWVPLESVDHGVAAHLNSALAWRRPVIVAAAVLVAAIGFSRLALGVHFLSDVLGAWALGVAWLGITAYATELWRIQEGRRPTQPLAEGLEPEAARDLKPTQKMS